MPNHKQVHVGRSSVRLVDIRRLTKSILTPIATTIKQRRTPLVWVFEKTTTFPRIKHDKDGKCPYAGDLGKPPQDIKERLQITSRTVFSWESSNMESDPHSDSGAEVDGSCRFVLPKGDLVFEYHKKEKPGRYKRKNKFPRIMSTWTWKERQELVSVETPHTLTWKASWKRPKLSKLKKVEDDDSVECMKILVSVMELEPEFFGGFQIRWPQQIFKIE